MSIYLDSGYLDIEKILSYGCTFNFITGARGIGKTYGILEYCVANNIPFMHTRRTATEVEAISKPETCSFKRLNLDKSWSINPYTVSKNLYGYYNTEEIDGKLSPTGSPIGYLTALIHIASIRGANFDDLNLWFHDEFIPESHARPIKREGHAFFNAYETMNRNRELSGNSPMTVICAANSNNVANPIFMELNIVDRACKMIETGENVYIDRSRSLALFMPTSSPISKKKETTALYALTKNSQFASMSLHNQFAYNDFSEIDSRDLRQYKPKVYIGGITIYHHKSNREIYVSMHRSGSPRVYGTTEIEIQRFRRDWPLFYVRAFDGDIAYECMAAKALFVKFVGLKNS